MAGAAQVAHRYQLYLADGPHEMLGFVIGFLLVTMGNFSQVGPPLTHTRTRQCWLRVTMGNASQANYDKAIASMNGMVQDGVALVCNVVGTLPGCGQAVVEQRQEFRRLVVLYFRLCCYEVRADIQARQNRATWLDPEGGISTVAEQRQFLRAATRIPEREWGYESVTGVGGLARSVLQPLGVNLSCGRFEIAVRPAMVHASLVHLLDVFYRKDWLPNAPVHAALLASLERYAGHMRTMMTVDRTPLPYSYVQMTSSLLFLFVLTLPFSFAEALGALTPLVAAIFAYAYGECHGTVPAVRYAYAYGACHDRSRSRSRRRGGRATSHGVLRVCAYTDTLSSPRRLAERRATRRARWSVHCAALGLGPPSSVRALFVRTNCTHPPGRLSAAGGLYINACNLRNPFNYDGTVTFNYDGLPINAFIQRLERMSEAAMLQVGARVPGPLRRPPPAAGCDTPAAQLPAAHRPPPDVSQLAAGRCLGTGGSCILVSASMGSC